MRHTTPIDGPKRDLRELFACRTSSWAAPWTLRPPDGQSGSLPASVSLAVVAQAFCLTDKMINLESDVGKCCELLLNPQCGPCVLVEIWQHQKIQVGLTDIFTRGPAALQLQGRALELPLLQALTAALPPCRLAPRSAYKIQVDIIFATPPYLLSLSTYLSN